MELSGGGFEKSELLKITEDIYLIKGQIADLKLELDSEQFHEKYLPKRRNLNITQSVSNSTVIIPLSIVMVIALIVFISCIYYTVKIEKMPALGIVMVFCAAIFLSFGNINIRIIRQQIEISKKLYYNLAVDNGKTKKKIEIIKEEIAQLNDKLSALTKKQQELIDKREETTKILRDQAIIVDVDTINAEDGKFKLKEKDYFGDNLRDLFELYSNEEKYINEYLSGLMKKLEEINKKISSIQDNFEKSKLKLITAGVIFIFMIILQAIYKGAFGNILCLVISVAGIFYLDKTCTNHIVMYLIENECELTKEYAFCYDLFPVRYQREEILKLIEENKKEIEEIRRKKEELDL